MSSIPADIRRPDSRAVAAKWSAAARRDRIARRSWRGLVGRCVLSTAAPAWMALDLLTVFAATLIGTRALVWWHPHASGLVDYRTLLHNIPLGCSVVLAGVMFGLYERSTLLHRGRIVCRCLLTIIFAMLATTVVVHVFLYSEINRRVAAFALVSFFLAATGIRLIGHRVVRHAPQGLVLIGHGAATSPLLRAIQHGRLPAYRLFGILSHETRRRGRVIRGVPVLGGPEEIERILDEHDVQEAVIADAGSARHEYEAAALTCLRRGCRVTDEATFCETAFGEVPVAHITPRWFFSADLSGQRAEHQTMKRAFDVCVALLGLALSAPLWPVIAALIRLYDGGPAFYAQQRVGLGGKLFTLLKFRTMRVDAETAGCVWAVDGDPRVTPLGRWLRRTRLDELPQLLNVLRGEMSMVGPRPERPDLVEPLSQLVPYYRERHLVKPGLTGWAQIRYRYGSSVSDARRKLQFDLFYIKHMSLELDLIILLRTVGTLLSGPR